MREMSVFDIIGPNMIGPSSSHTAGALKISLLAGKLMKAGMSKVTFILYGSFARTYQGHGTDKALVAGILGFTTEDIRIRDSFSLAAQAGIEIDFKINIDNRDVHPNTTDVIMEDKDGHVISVRGESIGGGAAVIRQINGIDVKLSGEYSTILVEQKDEKGVLAYITKCLSECDINIANAKLYRQAKGRIAYTIIEADQKISEAVIDLIEKSEHIMNATLIEI